MQNLNQIRARNVLCFATDPKINIRGQNGGEVIKKIPPVIMNNGFLGALAYSMDKNMGAWKSVFDGVAEHLSCEDVAIIPEDRNGARELLEYLADPNTTSDKLREATDEAMAWLEFARRLV